MWLLLCVFATILVASVTNAESGEAKLYKRILEDYEILERPVENTSDPVLVHLKLELQQIIDIDEKNQIMEINIWLYFSWKDYRFVWNPAEVDNVADIRLAPDKVWKPDILLANSVGESFDTMYPSNVVVYSDSTVSWIPPAIIRSRCSLDITWFPFDDQICYLKFGSWSYTIDKLKLINDGVNDKEYKNMPNGEWILMDTPSFISNVTYSGDSVYEYLYFNFSLRRRTLYVGFNMITPSFFISAMSILGFMLPAEAGEKITLEITILLSICVFMDMVAQVTPITSESVPLLSVFFFCHMIAVTVSIAFSVMVLNFHYRTPHTHAMSEWTRKILLNWLPWMLMMQRPKHEFEHPSLMLKEVSIPDSLRSDHSESDCRYLCARSVSDSESMYKNNNIAKSKEEDIFRMAGGEEKIDACIEKCIRQLENNENSSSFDYGMQMMLLSLQQIFVELKFITEHQERDDNREDIVNDWKFAAMVVDRLCLLFFTAFLILATVGVLLSAPHLVA